MKIIAIQRGLSTSRNGFGFTRKSSRGMNNWTSAESNSQGEFHPQDLTEPYVRLSPRDDRINMNPASDITLDLRRLFTWFTFVRLLITHLTQSCHAFSMTAHHNGSLPMQRHGDLPLAPAGRRWRANPPSPIEHDTFSPCIGHLPRLRDAHIFTL